MIKRTFKRKSTFNNSNNFHFIITKNLLIGKKRISKQLSLKNNIIKNKLNNININNQNLKTPENKKNVKKEVEEKNQNETFDKNEYLFRLHLERHKIFLNKLIKSKKFDFYIIYKNLFFHSKNNLKNYYIQTINNILSKKTRINRIYKELLMNIEPNDFILKDYNLYEGKKYLKELGKYYKKIYKNFPNYIVHDNKIYDIIKKNLNLKQNLLDEIEENRINLIKKIKFARSKSLLMVNEKENDNSFEKIIDISEDSLYHTEKSLLYNHLSQSNFYDFNNKNNIKILNEISIKNIEKLIYNIEKYDKNNCLIFNKDDNEDEKDIIEFELRKFKRNINFSINKTTELKKNENYQRLISEIKNKKNFKSSFANINDNNFINENYNNKNDIEKIIYKKQNFSKKESKKTNEIKNFNENYKEKFVNTQEMINKYYKRKQIFLDAKKFYCDIIFNRNSILNKKSNIIKKYQIHSFSENQKYKKEKKIKLKKIKSEEQIDKEYKNEYNIISRNYFNYLQKINYSNNNIKTSTSQFSLNNNNINNNSKLKFSFNSNKTYFSHNSSTKKHLRINSANSLSEYTSTKNIYNNKNTFNLKKNNQNIYSMSKLLINKKIKNKKLFFNKKQTKLNEYNNLMYKIGHYNSKNFGPISLYKIE